MNPSGSGLLDRFRRGLQRTRDNLTHTLYDIMHRGGDLESTLDDVCDTLILADTGVTTAEALVDALRRRACQERVKAPEELAGLLEEELCRRLEAAGSRDLRLEADGPAVFLVVGVNGTGKTTTCAKLAHRLRADGRSVLLAAADTFRAAAIEQLELWAGRAGVDVVRHQAGGDPAAVVFDAVSAARARGVDVVVADTAGRLHTRVNLMEELKKVGRVAARAQPGAPHEVLLVLDATTGQNGISQARAFTGAVDVTGLVLTKMDGTARGGVVCAIVDELGLPVKFMGIGEGMGDLEPFVPEAFARALLSPP